MINARWMVAAVAAIVGVIAGMLIGWGLWRPKPQKAETYAPAISQEDGSLVAERKPMKAEEVKIPHTLPKGATAERTGDVVFRPSAEMMGRTNGEPRQEGAESLPVMPELNIDWTLAKTKDDGTRMIFSSKDGEIISATDIPIVTPEKPRRLPWAAGGSWNPVDRTFGGWIQRDLGPFVVGAQVFQVKHHTISPTSAKWSGQITAGIRF